MDRTDSNNCLIPDRLNILAIKDLLGEGTFNHPCTAPWDVLLERNTSGNLAIGLKHAWSHLQTSFLEIATHDQLTDDALLLLQDVC